ncbi:restriction endonuclease [Agromyces sp. S2-1-8]|uniref:restriction endonuclease n=1 Tax=Agromyces sp. S2-1-8 TaxID=2897180 RepID=UPI001E492D56|nr:restriction endonuclease [Agromyces sp. S2-1-8]MCD5346032.1 restriction endonuclease [Agromyces sp. S2-1-8]
MRSLNSAHDAGAKIGRSYPDVWVPDEVLMQVIRAQIRPQIKLHRSDDDRHAEELGKVAGAVSVLAVMAVMFAVVLYLPVSLPAVFEPIVDARAFISIGALVLVTISVFAIIAHRRAERVAKARYSKTVKALLASAFQGAQAALEKRRRKEGMPLDHGVQRDSHRPDPMRLGVTPRGAEHLVAQWMRYLGEKGAEVTSFGGDGGVDVISARYIAQVKHFGANVGVAPIRELAGVAATDGRIPLFFTSTGYASGAAEFAERAGVALFVYSAERGELFGMNGRAKTIMTHGLG